MAWWQGDSKKGIALGEKSVAIYRQLDDQHGLANALRSLGQATLSFPESTMTLPLLEESIASFRELNDSLGLNVALIYYCWKLINVGNYTRAYSTAEESLQLAQEIGSINLLATTHFLLGNLNGNQGNNYIALSHLEKSYKLLKQAGNKLYESLVIASIGWGNYFLQQYERAKENLQRSMELWTGMGNSANAAVSACFLARIAYHQGRRVDANALYIKSLLLSRNVEIHDYNVAWCLLGLAIGNKTNQNPNRVALLLGAAEKFRNKTSVDHFNVRFEIERLIDTLHSFVDKKDIDASYNKGLGMTRVQAIDYALSEFATE
jgi:tetratricopeptide (TPR) repeat protein